MTTTHHERSQSSQRVITSKAGVIGLTRSITTEFVAQGVIANAMAPGLTRTPDEKAGQMSNSDLFALQADMQSTKRSEEVSDVVGAVSFLTSDDAVFIAGQTLYVNGGIIRTI